MSYYFGFGNKSRRICQMLTKHIYESGEREEPVKITVDGLYSVYAEVLELITLSDSEKFVEHTNLL